MKEKLERKRSVRERRRKFGRAEELDKGRGRRDEGRRRAREDIVLKG